GAVVSVAPCARARSEDVRSRGYFFDWRPVLAEMRQGYFPYTPATLMLYGLREAIRMLAEEGLPRVFARHGRLADGVRRAIHAWGLQILCRDPPDYAKTVTAVVVRDVADADALP